MMTHKATRYGNFFIYLTKQVHLYGACGLQDTKLKGGTNIPIFDPVTLMAAVLITEHCRKSGGLEAGEDK